MSMVPNIPGIPGPPINSSGSISPSGLPVHSEAKMVSGQIDTEEGVMSVTLSPSLQRGAPAGGFFPCSLREKPLLLPKSCAALPCAASRCCECHPGAREPSALRLWQAERAGYCQDKQRSPPPPHPNWFCRAGASSSKVTDGLEVGLRKAEPRAEMLRWNPRSRWWFSRSPL